MPTSFAADLAAPDAPWADAVRCDAVVVGSGATGLVAAITARLQGLDVHVVEKQPKVGGCSAYSLGMLWMPCNPLARRAGIADTPAAARAYLRTEMGSRYDADSIDAYLEHGPRTIEFLESDCGLRFELRENFPDYHSEHDGAAHRGRTLLPAPYDARPLGAALRRLRAPPPRATLFGMTFTPAELKLVSSRSMAGMRYLGGRFARHAVDMLMHGRSTHLTGGTALVAALYKKACDLHIPIHTDTAMTGLVHEQGRVQGAVVESRGMRRRLRARQGVVLACGGAGHDVARCSAWFAHPPFEGRSGSLGPEGCDGDGLRAGLAAGASVDANVSSGAFWAPVSHVPADGGWALSTHSRDRFRPGFMAVTPQGRRFVNEAESNHHFCEALIRATPPGSVPRAWLVCDQAALSHIGLGDIIHGAPFPVGRHLRSGYVLQRPTLAALGEAMGVDTAVFTHTWQQFNVQARDGRDDAFGKGSTRFNRSMGHDGHGPNPCLGPLEKAPFYAVRLGVGHMATLAGLRTAIDGQALDAAGRPIAGLFVAGNDRVNVFRGACPGGGITLGPGMTWAHLTGLSLARARQQPAAPTPVPEAAWRQAVAAAGVAEAPHELPLTVR